MTDGVTPDCKMALPLIQGFHAKKHLADKTHDSDKIVDAARKTKMKGCIPSTRRSLSTRYCKTTEFGDENELVNRL